MEEMIWRQYKDTNYSVSNTGRVKNNKTGKEITICRTKTGYSYVTIDRKPTKVHRMVAQCFIPNPDNLPQVNHKDEVRTNNNVENLEWCDNRYNSTYSSGKSVEQLKDGEVVASYKSISEAAEKTGVPRQHISACIYGKERRKSAGGFNWRFC